MNNPTKTTLTTWEPHGMRAGEIVEIHEPRWQKLRKLLTRPRLKVVKETTATTITMEERRMTWLEWGRAMLVAIFG